MNPRERFWSALRGEMADEIALTIWNNKLPGGDINNQLLDLEVLFINKSTVWKKTYLNIDVDVIDPGFAPGVGLSCPVRQTTLFAEFCRKSFRFPLRSNRMGRIALVLKLSR